MSETSLKFGPEWLRALSHGGSVSSPPSSPGPVKFKLAEYRYGREEMLALFCRELSPPDGLHNLGTLCIAEVQEPLAFTPMNSDEQRIWQRCVNSDAVLRSSGRAAPLNGVGRGRGGSVERGRGRGRGVGAPYYSRGISYDEESEVRTPREVGPPGMVMRAKVFERSQSVNESRGWGGERVPSERGPSERGPGGGSEERGGAVSPRKEPPRSFTENWRTRGGLDEDGDRWKALSNSKEKWVGRGAWRERENGAEGEWEESKGPNGGPQRNLRPPWEDNRDKDGQRRQWEEDNLPEWVTENAEDKGGSFDATGAFHAPGSSDEEEGSEFIAEKTGIHKARIVRNEREKRGISKIEEDGNSLIEAHDWSKEHLGSHETYNDNMKCHESKQGSENEESNGIERHSSPIVNGVLSDDDKSLSSQSLSQCKEHQIPMSISPPHLQKSFQVEDDKLEHMQSAADDLVAKLVEDDEPRSNEDNSRLHQPPPGGFISTEHVPLQDNQWFYTDPQGDIQGPFSSADMAAWCKAGYFKPDLLLRRLCDDKFAQLGDLTRVFGRVPFLPGPAVPPLKVSELLNAQKAERERYELMQAYHMQKQLYQQQTTLRQQQILQQLQGLEEWSSLNTGQQQQLFVQQMMSLPPLVAPVLPAGLQGSSTIVSTSPATVPTTSIDHRTNISNAPPPDPIQAFVAQMSTSNSVIPSASSTELTIPPPSSSNSGSIPSESPLQKLLLQLQRGSQQQNNLGNSLNLSSTLPTSHPSTLGQTSINSVGIEKPPEQFDAIQSLMSQLSKIQSTDSFQHEELKQREEEQKRIEEERKIFEEQKRAEEERMRLQEIRLQEERLKEDERRKELEQKNQRLEEELRRIQEEQTQRRKEENSKYKQQEEKRKQEHQQKSVELQKKEEDQKRHQVKQKQKQLEEENRRKEIEKRLEEAKKRKIEEENRKQEEEQKKKEENEKQHQMQIQEEMRRMALEEERRRMQQLEEEERIKTAQEEQAKKNLLLLQQKAAIAAQQEKLKQVPPAWNNKANAKEESYSPSLAEIQKAQEVKERKEREAESQRESLRQKEAQRQATEEKKQKEAKLKWASRVAQPVKSGNKTASSQAPTTPVKSLLEIQKEEEKELKKSQEKELAERAAAISHLSLNAAGVWGSSAQSLSWANRASTGAPTNISSSNITSTNAQGSQNDWGSSNSSNTVAWSAVAQSNANSQANSCWNSDSSSWTQPASQTSGGFWESSDSVKSSTKHSSTMGACLNQSPVKGSTNQQGNNKNASSQAVTSNNKANKKKSKDESDNVKKLFADNISSPADNFTQWCKNALHSMKVHASIDIPTFVGFLAEVESPYEVHDYIRSYLGDSKEVKEFAKQYLERRSKARNAQKEEHEDDNILAPAPAVNPVSSLEFQEVKTRLKKGKKKMQKVDNSILGFNVSSMERVGVEEGN